LGHRNADRENHVKLESDKCSWNKFLDFWEGSGHFCNVEERGV
jgi:hypothetical protein